MILLPTQATPAAQKWVIVVFFKLFWLCKVNVLSLHY